METTSNLWVWAAGAVLLLFVTFIARVKYKKVDDLIELHKFYDFVSTCEISRSSKAYIEQRLRLARAAALMEDEEFCNLVDEITTCYYSRFELYGYESKS